MSDPTRQLLVAFAFAPYRDVAAVDAVLGAARDGVPFDVIQNDMGDQRSHDATLDGVVADLVRRRAVLDTPTRQGGWIAVREFVKAGRTALQDWADGGPGTPLPYSSVASVGSYPHSHALAALVRHDHPALLWRAELPVPLARDRRGRRRAGSVPDGRVAAEMREILEAHGSVPPETATVHDWVDLLVAALADEIVIPHDAREEEVERWLDAVPQPSARDRAAARIRRAAAPQPPPGWNASGTHADGRVHVGLLTDLGPLDPTEVQGAVDTLHPPVRDRLRVHIFGDLGDPAAEPGRSTAEADLGDVVRIEEDAAYLDLLSAVAAMDAVLVLGADRGGDDDEAEWGRARLLGARGTGRPVLELGPGRAVPGELRRALTRLAGGSGAEPDELAALALRAGSVAAREQLLTAAASSPDPSWSWAAARTELLSTSGDREVGLSLASSLLERHGADEITREDLALVAGTLLTDDDGGARELLAAFPTIGEGRSGWALRTDLANPFRGSGPGDEQSWLDLLNEPFVRDGLEPVALLPDGEGTGTGPGETPYQRLTARAPAGSVSGDLITVVMSAYRPGPDLLMAVRGVVEQTWRDWELLVVDDASPETDRELLERAEAMDDRVEVIRAPGNGGTYLARNLALARARGRWMTFQDSDDWTHPRRLEVQARHLAGTTGALANRTWTLRAFPDLTLCYPGYAARRINASSLMVEVETLRHVLGGFDAVRKSADMELPARLETLRPGSVVDVNHPQPLAITQLRRGSLSRADAAPGWIRWDRIAYRELFGHWHRRLADDPAAAVLPAEPRPFPAPTPAWLPQRTGESAGQTFDVVVLADLREGRGVADTVRGEIERAGTGRVGLAHQETDRPLGSGRTGWDPAVLDIVLEGRVEVTDLSEDVSIDRLVVPEPHVLAHVPAAVARVGRVVLGAGDGPGEGSGDPDLRRVLGDVEVVRDRQDRAGV